MDPLDEALTRILPMEVCSGLFCDPLHTVVVLVEKNVRVTARGARRRVGFCLSVYDGDEAKTIFIVGSDSMAPYTLKDVASTDPNFDRKTARQQLDTWLQFCIERECTSPVLSEDREFLLREKSVAEKNHERMLDLYFPDFKRRSDEQ